MWIVGTDFTLTLNLLRPCVNFSFTYDSHSSSTQGFSSPVYEVRRTFFKLLKQLAADHQPATSFVEPFKKLLSC